MEKSGDLLKISQTDTDGLRGRPQPRHHARQGRLPERHLPAHPVHADHRQGARGAASRRPAVDQQVLHPRPDAAEELPEIRGRPGLHGLRRLVGQSGRAPRAQELRGLHARRRADGDRRRQARDRRRENQRRRLLRRRHAARLDARLSRGARRRAVPLGDLPHDAARFLEGRRPSAVHDRQPARLTRRR